MFIAKVSRKEEREPGETYLWERDQRGALFNPQEAELAKMDEGDRLP